MRQVNTIGVDPAKNVSQVCGIGQQGGRRADVMPANAGIHDFPCRDKGKSWIPAFAGMTGFGSLVPGKRAA